MVGVEDGAYGQTPESRAEGESTIEGKRGSGGRVSSKPRNDEGPPTKTWSGRRKERRGKGRQNVGTAGGASPSYTTGVISERKKARTPMKTKQRRQRDSRLGTRRGDHRWTASGALKEGSQKAGLARSSRKKGLKPARANSDRFKGHGNEAGSPPCAQITPRRPISHRKDPSHQDA